MKNSTLFPLERNRYFYGKLLTVRDFEIEQTYMNNKRRLLNKSVLGAGVVCGLGVTQADDFTLIVESGLALDYLGREIAVDMPVVRKLQMLPGYDALGKNAHAYLCLKYSEEPIEAVNAVASDAQDTQHNKVREGYDLYLSAEEPDVPKLLRASGYTNVVTLYQSPDVTVVFSMPEAALAGEEFPARILVMKTGTGAAVSFTLDMEGQFITDARDNPRIHVEMRENPLEPRRVHIHEITLKAARLSGSLVDLAPSGGVFTIKYGDVAEEMAVNLPCQAYLCENAEALAAQAALKDNLRARLDVEDLPLYLAKLSVIQAGASTILSDVHPLPFDQRLTRDAGRRDGGQGGITVSSDVETLKAWQKPEAGATYNHATRNLHLHFGIPAAQEYDYATSSGIVEIPLSTGMRVNARYVSEELPHNLGIGNVEISLSVEFTDEDGARAQFFGNREVFKSRGGNIPQVQTAAILYPEKGTFRVGAWLLDNVPGSVLRVRYYASKVVRDIDAVKVADAVSVRLTPEVLRIKARERVHLKATVYGSNDRGVTWAIVDKNGGSIDQNGLYQAPDIQGTYEVTAASTANPDVRASCFIIVEE